MRLRLVTGTMKFLQEIRNEFHALMYQLVVRVSLLELEVLVCEFVEGPGRTGLSIGEHARMLET